MCVCLDTKNERVDLAARIPRTFIIGRMNGVFACDVDTNKKKSMLLSLKLEISAYRTLSIELQ